ncbi:MAG: serine protease [Terriglobia bacterium]
MLDPAQLPSNPVDFRRFAKNILATPELPDALHESLSEEIRTRAIILTPGFAPPSPPPGKEALKKIIDEGLEAARFAEEHPDLPLPPDRDAALEAVVRLSERPAMLVRKDGFPAPPDRWSRMGGMFRAEISGRLPSVGRIDRAGADGSGMIGTGFVVGSDLVLTNAHVAKLFATPAPNNSEWALNGAWRATIDFRQEYGLPGKRIFAVTAVVGLHPILDLALLRVNPAAIDPTGAPLPAPVDISLDAPATTADSDLYAVGYPWVDNEEVTPPAVLELIFGGIYQVKRLQPGQFNAMFDQYGVFAHDCSTLGGSSGSPVVDLDTNCVAGIHYSGAYRQTNYAVALWLLQQDSLFAGRGLSFT